MSCFFIVFRLGFNFIMSAKYNKIYAQVVFHRVCLRPVCLRSDDAKLMNNFVFHIKKANFML